MGWGAELIRTSLPMCIPSLLYVLQNSLQLLAIKVPPLTSHTHRQPGRPPAFTIGPQSADSPLRLCLPLLPQYLDASAFSILSQLKILTTAVCSVLMLGTPLSVRKWRALGLLVIGAVLVQFPESSPTPSDSSRNLPSPASQRCWVWSAYPAWAGIYLEKFLKNKPTPSTSSASTTPTSPPTLWERNLQLSLYGMFFAPRLCVVQ